MTAQTHTSILLNLNWRFKPSLFKQQIKTSNKIGAALVTPVNVGRSSPVAFPTQTPTTYLALVLAQASRFLKLVLFPSNLE
jgi:hypothetical protein